MLDVRRKGEGRREKGEGRWEMGDGRREMGERRWEKGDGRKEKGMVSTGLRYSIHNGYVTVDETGNLKKHYEIKDWSGTVRAIYNQQINSISSRDHYPFTAVHAGFGFSVIGPVYGGYNKGEMKVYE